MKLLRKNCQKWQFFHILTFFQLWVKLLADWTAKKIHSTSLRLLQIDILCMCVFFFSLSYQKKFITNQESDLSFFFPVIWMKVGSIIGNIFQCKNYLTAMLQMQISIVSAENLCKYLLFLLKISAMNILDTLYW